MVVRQTRKLVSIDTLIKVGGMRRRFGMDSGSLEL